MAPALATSLPPTLVNSSLHSEGAEGIRVLTTHFRTRPLLEDNREDVRKLQDELTQLQLSKEKLEAEIKAVQANAKTLDKLEAFTAITSVKDAEKGVLNSESAIAMSKHVRESRRDGIRDLIEAQESEPVRRQ